MPLLLHPDKTHLPATLPEFFKTERNSPCAGVE
jgi:hypothetical protein